jgi:hypothetical protein
MELEDIALQISSLLLDRNVKDFQWPYSRLCVRTRRQHQQAHHKPAGAMPLSLYVLSIGPFFLLHLLSEENINHAFVVH